MATQVIADFKAPRFVVMVTSTAQHKQQLKKSTIMHCTLISYVFIACIFSIKIHYVISENEENIFQFFEPKDCKENEYFKIQTMSCEKCPNNLISTKNRLKCICDETSKVVGAKNGFFMCEACKNETTLTLDRNECISCQLDGVCWCAENEIRVERSLNGTLLENLQCLPCPDNFYVSIDNTKCLPCSAVNIHDIVNDATSMMLHQRIQKQCLEKNKLANWPDIRGTYLINFQLGGLDSYYLRTKLRLSVYLCQEGDEIACEHLSNICTLTLQPESVPCKIFAKNNLKKKLFYPASETEAILTRRSIPTRYTLFKNDINNEIKFVVAKFSLKGDLELLSDWTPPYFPPSFNNIRFGINIRQITWTTAKNLLNTKVEFFVPYLAFTKNDKQNKFLHQVPVLLKNNEINFNDISKLQLTQKFFTVDTVTGYGTIMKSENSSISKASNLVVLRYLKALRIEINLQERHERGKIFPPLIVVEYGELTQKEIDANEEIPIEFKIEFHFKDNEENYAFMIIIGTFIGIAVINASFKAWSQKIRSEKTSNIFTLIWFIIHCFGSIANALILCSLSVCIYTFIFYKGQTVLHMLLPDQRTETIVKICTIVAFGAKIVEVIAFLWHCRNVKIFFIDWEQPRNIQSNLHQDSPHTSLKKSYVRRFHQDGTDRAQTPSEIIGARRNRTPSKSSQASSPSRHSINRAPEPLEPFVPNYIDMNFSTDDQEASQNWMVSIWRTYFIANEWLKIKTNRKINVFLQALGTLLILEIVGFKTWNLGIPELTLTLKKKNEFVDESFTLKYALGAMIFIFIYTLQWFLSALYEKYVKNRFQGFVDLCSVANISIFILSYDYYGYYIHGRSVHGFADTDLLSLINDLKREENNLCAHRGLIPGTTEQTFVISVSKTFKSFYDALLESQNENEKKISRRNFNGVSSYEERWKVHVKMRKFLCGFLDHCFKNVDYTVKEKHVLEKLFDIELIDSSEKSVFYVDNHHSFNQTLFYGNEWILASFELTTFLIVLVLGGDYILSAIITIIFSKVISLAANFDKNRILANKTLIDERFLMS